MTAQSSTSSIQLGRTPRENRLASRRWLLLRRRRSRYKTGEDFCQTPDATDSRSALCFDMGRINGVRPFGEKPGSSGLRPRRALAGHPPDPAGGCALARITDPWTYLRDVLTKLARGWPQSRLGELVPTAWLAAQATAG